MHRLVEMTQVKGSRAPRRALLSLVCVGLAIPTLGVVIYLGCYYFGSFRPFVPRMNSILQNAATDERDVPPLVVKIIENNSPSVANKLSNVLPAHIDALETSHLRPLEQLLVWPILLRITFDKHDLYGLYAATAANGAGGFGMESSSMTTFSKRLSELNLTESASVAAIAIEPAISKDPVLLRSHAQHILNVAKLGD